MQLRHGDCLEEMAKIQSESIDLCITDCPYKIIAGGVRVIDQGDRGRIVVSDGTDCSNKRLKKDNINIPSAVKNGKMFDNNDIKFQDWLPELYRIMKNGTHIYIMINGRNLKDLQIEAEKVGFKYQNLLIWDKGNVTPNKYYMQGAEFILMLRKGPAKNINNLGSSNLLRVKNIIGNKTHPTEKPIDLIKIMIENSSNKGDLVLDLFMGSGSCGVACKNLNREFIGIEIDKTYFEIAKNRILK